MSVKKDPKAILALLKAKKPFSPQITKEPVIEETKEEPIIEVKKKVKEYEPMEPMEPMEPRRTTELPRAEKLSPKIVRRTMELPRTQQTKPIAAQQSIIMQPDPSLLAKEKTFSDLLDKDEQEEEEVYQARTNITLYIYSEIKPQLTPRAATQVGRLFIQKILYGVTYPHDIEAMLESIYTQLIST